MEVYTLFNVKRISTAGKRQISNSRRMLRAVLCTFVICLAFGGGAATVHRREAGARAVPEGGAPDAPGWRPTAAAGASRRGMAGKLR